MSPPDPSESAPENHFLEEVVLYMDFLGVSEAATSWDPSRSLKMIELLQDISTARGRFNIQGRSLSDGSYEITSNPEVSTFSDHIVASWPVFSQIAEELAGNMYINFASRLVGQIALDALKIGVLVRGGLTLGSLFHRDGVVFGEAMLDAHRLESRVANYPRVVVSSRIYTRHPSMQKSLSQDRDGIWHLPFIKAAFDLLPADERAGFKADRLAFMQRTIDELEKAEKWNEFAKWKWFQNEFVREVPQ